MTREELAALRRVRDTRFPFMDAFYRIWDAAPALLDAAEETLRWREDAACPSCGGREFRLPSSLEYACMDRWHYLDAAGEVNRDAAEENARLRQALLAAAIPLEVLLADADANGPGSLAPNVVENLRQTVLTVREALAIPPGQSRGEVGS